MTAVMDPTEQPVAGDTPVDEQPQQEAQQEQPAGKAPAEDKPGETAVVRRGFLSIDPEQTRLTDDQRATLSAIGITAEYDPAQIRAFLHFCQVRDLDPYAKEAYLIRYKGYNGNPDKYATIMSINTYRAKAFATGRYRGKVGVYLTGDASDPDSWIVDKDAGVRRRLWDDVWLGKEPPAAAKVVIEYYDERGDVCRTEAVANYEMFVATTYDRKAGMQVPNSMWSKGAAHMLSKCAEALALRSTFPATFAGTYIPEEMSRVEQESRDAYMQQVVDNRKRAYEQATSAAPAAGAGAGKVIDGDLADTPDAGESVEPAAERLMLMGELVEQARILGTSMRALGNRLVLAHRCDLGKVPVPALRALVVGMRSGVADRVQQTRPDAADVYRELPKRGHEDGAAILAAAVPGESVQAG